MCGGARSRESLQRAVTSGGSKTEEGAGGHMGGTDYDFKIRKFGPRIDMTRFVCLGLGLGWGVGVGVGCAVCVVCGRVLFVHGCARAPMSLVL